MELLNIYRVFFIVCAIAIIIYTVLKKDFDRFQPAKTILLGSIVLIIFVLLDLVGNPDYRFTDTIDLLILKNEETLTGVLAEKRKRAFVIFGYLAFIKGITDYICVRCIAKTGE